jgi:hypothetical protein
MKAAITEICRDKWGASVRKIAKELSPHDNPYSPHEKISKSTVSRYLRTTSWGHTAYTCKIKPMLTARNIADRRRFCIHAMNLLTLDTSASSTVTIENLLFTDESIVELFTRPNRQNTRIRSSNPQLREPVCIPEHGLKIMVAGGICYNGLTELHIVEVGKTINGEYYRNRILPIFSLQEQDGLQTR